MIMCKRARVFWVRAQEMRELLSGRMRLGNLPSDAVIAAFERVRHQNEEGWGIRVQSDTYPEIDHGAPLPVMTSRLERV